MLGENELLMNLKLQINLYDCILKSIKPDEYLTHSFKIHKARPFVFVPGNRGDLKN